MRPHTRDYADVDTSHEPEVLLACLDQAEALTTLHALRELTYELVPGGDGVDVGCGHGRAVADLCERGVNATGVDRSEFLVEAARRRFPNCAFDAADAALLPFPDRSLHWYRAERVYQHIPDAPPALKEARRVLRPGGTVIIADQDHDSTIITSADPGLTTRMLHLYTSSLPQGRSGSRMRGMLAGQGFIDIRVAAVPMVYTEFASVRPWIAAGPMAVAVEAGVISAQQATSWMVDLQQRDRHNQFLFAHMMFITSARRPGLGPMTDR